MSTQDERDLSRLGALGRELDGEVLASVDVLERRRLLAALERPRRTKLAWRGPALAAVVAVAAIFALVFWPGATLDYEVRGATAERGFVEAAEDTTVAFSDGTTVLLRSGSMGRVVEVTEHGARIHLERGQAELSVTPRSEAQWTVGAGPYEVRVTGTRFTVDWSPEARRFSVSLIEGEVVVDGPLLGRGLELRPGQTLRAEPGDVRVREASETEAMASNEPGPPSSPAAAASGSPASPPVWPTPSASASSPSAPAASSATVDRVSWAQLLAEGKHDEVMQRARSRGIGSVLSGGSPGELTALGDAARYTGDGATGRKALEQLRKRFPGHPAAKTAAFLLGRMSEGSPGAALRYYDLYLAESPGGAYAAEAEGRKLVLSQRRPSGVVLARAYLQKYPKGPYAPLARQLISSR